ncbi:DUF4351 domain-containing protein [Gloeothece verrucosa]|uniref:DUF4351 domain-containing protein n=1 Tax=Gloeothece verrucosa (strain PCC 7822) TaxID=497965 RepID=E0UAB7_GLOV7|nr:DUF4351 domain-containing protein [Gloeothece verrucosa]ADN17422.1 conserved hypothetical protein [Gloeothece verrucosa PCC 7822]
MPSIRNWIDEGREEGFREGMQIVIKRQLAQKIGIINPPVQKQLEQLSVFQLENLAIALLDFSGEQDLRTWLNEAMDNRVQ